MRSSIDGRDPKSISSKRKALLDRFHFKRWEIIHFGVTLSICSNNMEELQSQLMPPLKPKPVISETQAAGYLDLLAPYLKNCLGLYLLH